MSDVEKHWKRTWEPLVMRDGKVDVEQLKKELSDFSELIERHSELVGEITHGRLSYVTYQVKTILNVTKEVKNEDTEQQKKDDKEDGACSLCDREF